MRVLHLIYSFGTGGAERQLALLAREMISKNIEVAILYVLGGPNMSFIEGLNIKLVQVKKPGFLGWRVFIEICKLIVSWKPDVIQTWLLFMDILGGVASLICRKCHIMTERSSGNVGKRNIKIILRIVIAKFSSALVANSNVGARYWMQFLRRDKVYVIHNCISPLSTGVPEFGLDIDFKKLLVVVGRLAPEKNPLSVLKAFKMISNEYRDCGMIYFGEGPMRKQLMSEIESCELSDRVRLLGYSSDLGYWFQQATALVSASYIEGHPNAVIEAAFARVPLILSSIESHLNAVSEGGALFSGPDDWSEMARNIMLVLEGSNIVDSNVDVAYDTVSDLNVSSMTDSYLRVYVDAINS